QPRGAAGGKDSSGRREEMVAQTFRDRVVRFYEAYVTQSGHAPEKIGDVDKIVAQTGGTAKGEEKLMEALVDKYGPEPLVSDPEALRRWISAFYKHYNPAKLDKVDNLVQRTKGKANYEARLMAMLVEKYGEEPESLSAEAPGDEGAQAAAAAPPAAPDASSDDDDDEKYSIRARVVRFYEKYAPEKLCDVDKLVARTVGKPSMERKLMEALVDKYGPEPDTDDEDAADGDAEEDDIDGTMIKTSEDSPLREIVHCPVDGMPPEYCEYLPTFMACLDWLETHFPNLVLTTKKGVTVAEFAAQVRAENEGAEGAEAAGAASKSKRGGAGMPNKARGGKKGKKGEPGVTIERSQRQKRKYVTSVIGLDTFDVKLKEAAKKLGRRFACGASVNKTADGRQSIDIQGDCIYDLPELLLEYFPAVQKDKITLINEGKKSKAFN
ncbi:Density-regulated protein (DRP), partial [Durusdinium trenchii]